MSRPNVRWEDMAAREDDGPPLRMLAGIGMVVSLWLLTVAMVTVGVGMVWAVCELAIRSAIP